MGPGVTNIGYRAGARGRRQPSRVDTRRLRPRRDAVFGILDAIARFFAKATQQVPIVAVIDDLHWADAPSLSLLEFLSNELPRCRLLIVGTYRDNEVSRKSPLQHTLGGLGKDAGVVRVRLSGIPEPAIAALAQLLIGPHFPAKR